MTVEPGNARSRPRAQASASSVAGSASSRKLASDSGPRSSSRHQFSREAESGGSVACSRWMPVSTASGSLPQSRATPGSSSSSLPPPIRPPALQPSSRQSPRCGRSICGSRSMAGPYAAETKAIATSCEASPDSPCNCSAASATAASSRAPRPMALVKDIRLRGSGAGTDFLVGNHDRLAAGLLDPVAEVRIRRASCRGSDSRAPTAAARSCARAAQPARTSRRPH